MRQWKKATISLLILMALSGCSLVTNHHDNATEFSGVPIIVAIRTAMGKIPGNVIEAKFERSEGFLVYHIQIVDLNHKTHHIYVDAESGHIRDLRPK